MVCKGKHIIPEERRRTKGKLKSAYTMVLEEFALTGKPGMPDLGWTALPEYVFLTPLRVC